MDGLGSRSPAGAHVDSFTAKAHGHVPDGAFVVPDPNLIFNGEFKRAGLDLVLSHDGHEFVVHDYFRGEKRAALASPDGAHLTGDIVNALTGHVQVAQAAPGGAAAAQVIGHVTKLAGSATAVRNGVSVILNNGDNVEKGDVVSTGSDSTLGITFIDGTVFGLSSNARMVLNEMVYDPNGSSNSSLLSLVAGTITFVAGETAKHGDMKIDTPVATMGIRGTAVLTQINFVVPAGGGDPQPQASFQVLVEPNGTTGSYILFDKVTLLPIATVNQAGQMIQISGGNVSISNALMSPDVQKLITDVFTLKFTDNNTNTKLTTNFTDTLTPMSQDVVFKSASGAVATATFVNLNPPGPETPSTSTPGATRIPNQPIAQSFDASGNVTSAFALTERADATGDTHADTISGLIRFLDQNLGDRPTVSVSLADAPNYVYKDAGQHDVTGSLSALQKQDIAATQIQISVAPGAGNDNNGSAAWTYTIPDKVFDFLAAGETLTLTYMFRVDTNFAVSPESKFIPITITITGTNDKPTVATSGGTVIEKIGTGNEALDTITGTVTFTDVDLTDRPIVSAALSSTQPFKYLDAEGNDITSTLTPQQLAAIAAVEVPLTVVQGAGNANNGSATWTYSVPDHLFDFLAKGEKLTLNYVAQVDDGHGGVVSTPVTVSINGADVNVEGTNDVPTIVADDTTPAGAVTEDTAATLVATGTIAFNDPDLTDTHTASFSLKSTISSAHLPGFSDGTSHIGTFALAPVVESPGASSRGAVGWTFTLDDSDPVLQSLAKGQTITQVYTIEVDDHHGGTVTQDVTVTITGTNDTPTITSDAEAAAGSVTEDAATPTLTAGGTLAIQDLDLIDTHSAEAVFKSATSSAHLPGFDGDTPLGTFTIDPSVTEANDDTSNGATLGWHFVLNDNDPVLQSLAKGQTITQVYTVTFTDNNGAQVSQDVTVTITGTNDAPTITSDADAAAGSVTEDAATPTLSTGGTLAIQDLDLIDTHSAEAVFKSATSTAHLPGFDGDTPLGTFTIDQSVTEASDDTSNGATLGWHFVLNDNDPVLQSLAKGQTITQVYTVTFIDNNGAQVSQDVTVTITGTNDAPTITSDADAAAGAVTEDAATPTLSTGGTLAIQDLDLIDTHTAEAVFKSATSTAHLPGFDGNTPLGTFTIDPSVTEANDDTSNGATLCWHFALNDNDPVLQSLAKGQTITQVYTVTFTDNNGAQVSQDVTVTITGTNDTPTITSDADAAAGSVTEDAATPTLTAGGTLAIQDLDLIDTHSAEAVFKSATSTAHLPGFDGDTPLGTFTIDSSVTEANDDTSNGATLGWHFVLNDNDPVLQSLAKGQTITQVYTVTFTDNNGAQVSQDVTVTITGTNDTPTITSDADAAAGSVTEDASATLSIDGTLAIQDLDLIDTHSAEAVFKSATSSAHLPGFDGDAPLGTFTIDSSVAEFNNDADNGATLGWHFSLDNGNATLQSLAQGQTITQVYTVTFTDDHGAQIAQDVTVTINGANDAPTITSSAAAAAGVVTEDASATLSIDGTLAIQDLDLIDTHSAEATFKSSTSSVHLPGFDDDTPLGTFTIDSSVAEFNNDTDNGATLGWHFSLDNGNAVLQSLAEGQAITQVYTVTFTDDHGAQIAQDVTVTINGANDAPTITSDADAARGTVNEDDGASLTTGGTLAIQDVDLTDTHTAEWSFKSSSVSTDLPGFGASSHIGTFSIDPVSESATDTNDGATLGWHFALDNSDPVLQSLAEGQTITQVYTVTFDDQHGGKISQDVTVTITGTNDAPAVSYVTSDYMNFDGHTIAVGDVPTVATDGVTLDGWVNWNGSSDPGHGQVLFYNGNTSTTGFGLLGTVNIDGTLELQILAGGVDIADTGVALTASQWHNIALTHDNGAFTLYLDGNLEYSQSWGGNPIDGSPSNPSASYMMIGAASEAGAAGFGAEGFFGSIADVSVWTTALTQVQIQSIDFTALTGNEANLAGYYQLGDGSGTTASNTANPAKSLVIEGDADWASGTSGPGGAVADLMETNAGQLTHGLLAVSDVDATDHVTVSVSELQVTLDGVLQTDSVGGLSQTDLLNYLSVPSGDILDGTATHAQFTWQFNSGSQAFDFLAAGQTLSLQYTIVPDDGHGAGTAAVVTVDITGSNDAPTLADLHIGPLSDTAAPDTFSDLTGMLAGHDADTGETETLTYAVLNADHHAATTVAGLYGSLTVNPDGSYSYVPDDAAINALADGSYADVFTVQTTDVHGATGTATLTVDVTGADEAVANPADGPVINTESFQVEHIIENNSDVITNLLVTEVGAADHDFTVAVSTAHPGLSQVDFFPTSGSLDEINLGFETGATYNPTGASSDPQASPPATEQITLTVTDKTTGLSDIVNFVFNEAGDTSQGITLAGTGGKDVIFSTDTNDTLIGGAGKDQFVFSPGSIQYDNEHNPITDFAHTINDFEIGVDKIDLRLFSGVSSIDDLVIAPQSGGDTLVTWSQRVGGLTESGPVTEHESLLLKSLAGNLQASDFIFGSSHIA
ncbi:VCBS domain-containing protein [Bradyrhizobium amphicarpaeae]|nr:VCBS domain-containing protein [Bradyrhizobium amphicarpaeae]